MLLLLLACTTNPAQSEGARFADALRSAGTAPDAAVTACEGLDTLRGECLTAVAAVQAGSIGVDAGELCARVAPGVWRDECHFEVAEQALHAAPADRAAQCAQAGSFAPRCRLHLWNEVAQDLLQAGALPEAVEAFRTHVDWVPDEEDIAWAAFWEAQLSPRGHQGPAHYDLATCEALLPRDQRDCRRGIEVAFRRASQLTPCGETLSYAPDDGLRRWVERREKRCSDPRAGGSAPRRPSP